ncbi:hypothetical protein FOE78_17480 [Microlunatus elymi]|uniref:Uncharacterized protein n=1 Tax=Microlunatus elymi TaxID=2596828 RepID=A0A516Q240_9ACTN|nr:hypothetical protein [Microlunatus elymi]QDP97468.1 hypothetical protein FOE78_17480 [Microlunatus elymi]
MKPKPRRRIVVVALAGCLVAVIAIGGRMLLADRSPDAPDAAPTVLKPGCPAVLPGISGANQDFFDLIVWEGHTYLRADDAQGSTLPETIRVGRQVTRVGCSLTDPASTNGNRVTLPPWPDRVATGLPAGTPFYAVRGFTSSCVLGVEHDAEVIAYVAVDLDHGDRPLC